jgi:hypothetical protein
MVNRKEHCVIVPLAVLILISCPNPKTARAVVVLDEAFVAAYPSLSASLQAPRAFSGPFSARRFGGAQARVLSMSQGAGPALDAVKEAEGQNSGKNVVLVTSPLIASALVNGGAWRGEPCLLVPEWPGGYIPGLISVATDPIPAYTTAGAALGAYSAALARDGGPASCGILFAEGPGRPRAALEAFARAYNQSSGSRGLIVRELDSVSDDQGGKNTGPQAETTHNDPSTIKKAASIGPEEAVKEMLGTDIRALFIALGPDTITALRAAVRPGLALGADYAEAVSPKSLVFRIRPDHSAFPEAIARELTAIGSRGSNSGAMISVPSRVEIDRTAAAAFKAGGRTLDVYLREALKRSAR